MHAAPTVCAGCAANLTGAANSALAAAANVPVPIVASSGSPNLVAYGLKGIEPLQDGILNPTQGLGANNGAQAASANYNWIQAQAGDGG